MSDMSEAMRILRDASELAQTSAEQALALFDDGIARLIAARDLAGVSSLARHAGTISAHHGMLERALAYYEEALRCEPNDAWVHLARGGVLQELERQEQARAAFDRAFVLASASGDGEIVHIAAAKHAILDVALGARDIEELESYRARVLQSPVLQDLENGFELTAGDLPPVPAILRACKVHGVVGPKFYHRQEPATQVQLVLTPEAAEGLAFVIIAILLRSNSDTVQLVFSSSPRRAPRDHSELTSAMIGARPLSARAFGGLRMRPHAFRYEPEERGRHPLQTSDWTAFLPHVCIDDLEGRGPPHGGRNTLYGFGDHVQSATFATALLDISRSAHELNEYDFEGPGGFGGVAPGSAEIKIWFPGSIGWELYGTRP
jgi:tetratricopeptide (TPR) repeat protein